MDASIWAHKVARYRKWEQKRDRAVSEALRLSASRMLDQAEAELRTNARDFVLRHINDKIKQDQVSYHSNLISRVVRYTGPHYEMMVKESDPDCWYFRLLSTDPWIRLGYFNNDKTQFLDTPKPIMSWRVDPPRPDALTKALSGAILETKGTEIDMRVDDNTNPDDPEAAATHALAEAARLRAVDELEPDGDEPTISWVHTPDYPDAKTYTYVAFKAENDLWYVSGYGRSHAEGVQWRKLALHPNNKALAAGDFLIVSEWAHA